MVLKWTVIGHITPVPIEELLGFLNFSTDLINPAVY